MKIEYATTFVLKVVEICNLKCSYCYMYEFDGDISGTKPSLMSEGVFEKTVERIAEHAHHVPEQELVLSFHGGEPLLLGRKRFARYLAFLRKELGGLKYSVGVQTNGVLLDERWLDLFVHNDVRFGISLDGPAAAHDRHRLDRGNKGTHASVEAAIRLTLAHPASTLFGGAICVASGRESGAELVDYFLGIGVNRLTFLLPDGNYLNPPKDFSGDLGVFLIDAFDRWFDKADPTIEITPFSDIVRGLLGGQTSIELLAGVNGSVVVVESDGAFLAHDVLRTCGQEHDRAPHDIFAHPFSMLRDEQFFPWKLRHDKCERCVVLPVCGGGFPPSRFDGLSFENPSYHCDTLYRLIKHAARRVLPAVVPEERGCYPVLGRIYAGGV